jgi:hypothetical protein
MQINEKASIPKAMEAPKVKSIVIIAGISYKSKAGKGERQYKTISAMRHIQVFIVLR